MTRTAKRSFPGVYEVHEDGGYIGMIRGSEQYTGTERRHWIVSLAGEPVNHLWTLKEAKAWAGVA